MCVVQTARYGVDFVPPKLFPCINIFLKLLQNEKMNSHAAIWVSMKRDFWGSI